MKWLALLIGGAAAVLAVLYRIEDPFLKRSRWPSPLERESARRLVEMRETYRAAVCACGHGPELHDMGGICFAKLDTFPEGGFYGVCPCTPGWLEDEERP